MMRFVQHQRTLLAALTLLSLLISAFCALLGGNAYWRGSVPSGDANLLTMSNALSPANLLPRTYFEKIKALPQVEALTEYSSVALFLANERQLHTGVIVDKDQIAATFPRMALSASVLQRWQERKDAILVSEKLLTAKGLQVGDMLPSRLFYGNGEQNQAFYVAGTFDADNELHCTACVFLGRDFADQALASYHGVVGSYHIRVGADSDKNKVRRALDALFANEVTATRSTEFLPASTGFLNELIDLRQLVMMAFWLTLAAAILLPALCANMIAFNHRAELALLLAFGMQKKHLFVRAVLLAAIACLVIGMGGLGLAWIAGGYLFDDLVWLRFESAGPALAAALGLGTLIAVSSCASVLAVVRTLEVGNLFTEAAD